MQAGENERYAGEDVAVSGFDDVRFPDELDFARQHRIRPLFVMPEDQQEIIRMFQFMSKLLKVRRHFFVCLTPRLNPMKSTRTYVHKFCKYKGVAQHRGSIRASHPSALGSNTTSAISLYCLVCGQY